MLLELKKISKLSEKLKEYIKKVEEETGRPVLIKSVQNVGLGGISLAFISDPECKRIQVEIVERDFFDQKKEKIDRGDIEWAIAHEISHGFLCYKKKHYQFEFKSVFLLSKLEENSVRLLFTMIEEALADKIMYENNFQPLPKGYIDNLKGAIKMMQDGKDSYKNYDEYPLIFKNRFMVFTFIIAWGHLKYINLNGIEKKTIHKFLKMFQKSCPKQYEEAKNVEEIMLENDISTTEGFNKAIKKCLDLWKLTDLVRLYTC